ncbi:MAG: DUF2791 family P-loop domain-containing protein [Dehalococcoidia bacterium]|nr:DUF2791 family P-loop domain-containing protein [Dehalococcoidia bacterium]
MNADINTQSRRAIEALRAGVPNQDAVRALGSSQPDLEKRFKQQLQAAKEGFSEGKQAVGMLVTGGFGSGKSHLLEHFEHVALEENFVCSKVVISKETPLYEPAKVFRSAMQDCRIPGKRGTALSEIASSLKFDSLLFSEFERWVNQPDVPLSLWFAATLYLYRQEKHDEEIRDRIIRFWSGDPIGVVELKKWLREINEAASYKIDRISVKELALQRYSFTPRLMVAAGYSGWVLLIDEVELIGSYSLRQRARSYAELSRFMGKLEGVSAPGMSCVLTITDDFQTRVLEERNDEEKIPGKLRAGGSEPDLLLASQAERGMQLIRTGKVLLEPPNPEVIKQTYEKLRSLYASAYACEPPANYVHLDRSTSTVMRQHVKRWITEWDLKRLYPDYKPDMEVKELSQSYGENPDLEAPSEDSPEKNEPRE